ncbi:hypothetical protein QOZ80_1AG0008690 [Eleusine coracana subsp. coracana]|nr:hypothetical protein QOZ80_1AG0008690 [Eleusine coracana subsp. coracana]
MSLVRLFDTLALDTWKNPFSIFGTLLAADAWLASDTSAFANTYIESRETAAAYVFSAALPPGVKKEEVRVEVDEGNVLVITGERSVRRGSTCRRTPSSTASGRPWTKACSRSPCPRLVPSPPPPRSRRRRSPSRPVPADRRGGGSVLARCRWCDRSASK